MYIEKGELWALLDNDALNFAGWLAGATPQAIAMNKMLENTKGITLDSAFVQQSLIPLLLSLGVITQITSDRIGNFVAKSNAPAKNYSMPIPVGIVDYVLWLKQYCDLDFIVSVGGDLLTVTTKGDCTAPNAELV